MSLIDKILVNGSERFYTIRNAHGKEWIMPARNMRTAMALYQPGSANGHRLKRWFPMLHRFAPVRRRLGVETRRVQLHPQLQSAVAEAFGTDRFEWSIFGGTPCVHQKITMQIFSGAKLLGYVKLTDSDEVRALFDHEQRVLDTLSAAEETAGKSVAHPEILYCGYLTEAGVHMLIQTTSKTLDSVEQHAWTEAHSRYVDTLAAITTRPVKYEDSDFYRVIHDIDPYLPYLASEYQDIIRRSRDAIDRDMSGRLLPMGIFHGDFTPWNMVLLHTGEIFAFDWEYSQLSYPIGLDRWHFTIQSAIFESPLSHDEIVDKLKPYLHDTTLRLYLLSVISHFTKRERGRFSGDLELSLKLWCTLLSLCQ